MSEGVRYYPIMPRPKPGPRLKRPKHERLHVVPQLTKAEITELKQRSAADGRSVGQYVAVLMMEDLMKGKPVLRTSHPGRKTQGYEINFWLRGNLSRKKVEARAKAEMRSLSGYVGRVIVVALGR